MTNNIEKTEILDLMDVSNFTELYDYIDKTYQIYPDVIRSMAYNIEAGIEQTDADALKEVIESVRKGESPDYFLTNKIRGLRDKVIELRVKELENDKENFTTNISLDLKKNISDNDKIDILGLDDFDSLYDYLKTKDSEFFKLLAYNVDKENGEDVNAKDVIELIESIRKGENPIETISDDIAVKVIELIAKEERTIKTRERRIDEIKADLENIYKSKTYAKKEANKVFKEIEDVSIKRLERHIPKSNIFKKIWHWMR